MKKIAYPACFYPESDGSYFVEIPDLGLATQGTDNADAVYMAADAITGFMLDSVEHGESVTAPSDITEIRTNPEQGKGFVSLVLVDIEAMARNHSKKSVNKTVTLPEWLTVAAEKRNLNYSAVLRTALIEEIASVKQ